MEIGGVGKDGADTLFTILATQLLEVSLGRSGDRGGEERWDGLCGGEISRARGKEETIN